MALTKLWLDHSVPPSTNFATAMQFEDVVRESADFPDATSVFDRALHQIRRAYLSHPNFGEDVPGIAQTVLLSGVLWTDARTKEAAQIVEAILLEGIDPHNCRALAWIAHPGPMRDDPDPSAPCLSIGHVRLLAMRVAFYKLIDLIRKADLDEEVKIDGADCVCHTLSRSWHGISGWLN